MLTQKNPITQRDFQAAAADLMQANPELFAQIENLRRQNRAQIQRGVAAVLTGKPQPPGVSMQAVFADDDALARRRAELEKQRNQLIRDKLKAQGATADIADDIIAGESRVFQSGLAAESSAAGAAIQARSNILKAMIEAENTTGNKLLDLTGSKGVTVEDYFKGNDQAAKRLLEFKQAARAAAADPNSLNAVYQNQVSLLSPTERQNFAAMIRREDPALFDSVSKATNEAFYGDLVDYQFNNMAELARAGALAEKGLALLQGQGLPESYYDTVQVKTPDGKTVEVKRPNEKALQPGGYSAFNARKGRGMREMANEFQWVDYVQNILSGADDEVDPVLKQISQELKNLKTTTAGVDTPTVSRATLRTDADVRARAKAYAQARLAAREELVTESDAGEAAKARRLGRIRSQRELLEANAPVLGTRQKQATQKAQRMLRRGTRFELGDTGKYQQKSAPMSVAQQFAALGSRSKPGALTAEMESGMTASGAQSKDYEKGGKPITAAGDSAKTGLAGLGQAMVDSSTEDREEGEESKDAAQSQKSPGEDDADEAAILAAKFFSPDAFRQRLGLGLQQRFRSRRGIFDGLDGDDVDEVNMA